MSSPSFDLLRSHLRQTPEGMVLDSFFAVEIGLEDYETFWNAHYDFMSDVKNDLSLETIIGSFIVDLGEETDYGEIDFVKLASL